MLLPNDSVGISDIEEWRRCPASFAYKMRRHTPLPPHLALYAGERDDPTEATGEGNAYGSCIHEVYAALNRGASDAQAISQGFAAFASHLAPEHLTQLKEDVALWHARRPDPAEWETIAVEQDRRVPLFGAQDDQGDLRLYYYRFKIDVLLRSRTNPSLFMVRDYKSQRLPLAPAKVHGDRQQWSYNFGVHALYPECRQLLQVVDYLRGAPVPTSKNDAQRAEMRAWLTEHVKAIVADDLLAPKANDFCRWCPMVVTCRETKRLTKEWRAKLALFAPLTKEGRKIKVEFAEDGDDLEAIIRDDLPRMMQVKRHIEHVETKLKGYVAEMPVEERARLGWLLNQRKNKTISPDGLRELHTLMGDQFYHLAHVSITALEDLVGKPKKGQPVPPELAVARQWTVEEPGAKVLTQIGETP